MLTYVEAKRLLAKRPIRKLARNTYLRAEGEDVVVKFWDTDIITIDKEGIYTLNTSGYRTLTTKDRLNEFGPARVSQEKGIWYIRDAVFADGIKLSADGKVLSGQGAEDFSKIMRKVDKLVSKYITGYIAHLMKEKGLSQDTGGDCLFCQMQDVAKKVKEPMGYDHYLMHFEEEYYVTSILMKGITESGYSDPGFIWWHIDADLKKGHEPYHLRHILRKFFKTRKQGIAEALQAAA